MDYTRTFWTVVFGAGGLLLALRVREIIGPFTAILFLVITILGTISIFTFIPEETKVETKQ